MVLRRDAPLIQVRVGSVGGDLVRVEEVIAESSTRHGGHIMSLAFEDDEKKADKLTLIVDNFSLDHIDSPIWRKGNRVEAQWGYPGFLSPLRSFTIQKVQGSIKLKVECGYPRQVQPVEVHQTVVHTVRLADGRQLGRPVRSIPAPAETAEPVAD